jgi:hypothetical protein
MDAPAPLASVIIDTVYFDLPQAAPTDDDPAPTMDVDVSMGFTGGTAEGRIYKLGAVANADQFGAFSYELDGSMLTLKMGEQEAPTGSDPIEDITIPIQATDTNGAVATTTVIVRGNVMPAVSSDADIVLTVGLQDAPTKDGDDMDMDPDDYDGQTITDGDVTCVMLNSCEVMLMATDRNRDDSSMWMFYNPSDTFMAVATKDGVMITGLKAGAGASVYVWPVDEGGLPMADEDGAYRVDSDDADDLDETKFPAGAREIQVTIDPPPHFGDMMTGQDVTLPAQTLKSQDDPRVLGTLFNDPSNEGVDLEQEDHEGIVDISFVDDGTVSDMSTDASAGELIQAAPRNLTASRRTFEFTVTERAVDNSPTQFLNVSVDITVSND